MSIVQPYGDRFQSLLFDESRTMGRADFVALPRCEEEIVEAVRFCGANGVPLTAQGARTGLAGGASPEGGLILNLSRMNRILGIRRDAHGRVLLRAQPGAALLSVRKALSDKMVDVSGWSAESLELFASVRAGELFFSPDPTEPTASVGGMASCNACGARSFLYGATRRHIHALRVVLADGRVAELERGRDRARGREFSIPCADGTSLSGQLPDFDTPDIKDAGYFFRPDMDLVDLFIGSQGTLGIVSELELILMPAPKLLSGVTAFFPDDECALSYVAAMKRFSPKPASIEFFDRDALALVERQKAETPAFRQLQELPENYCSAVYVEFNLGGEDELYPALERLSGVLAETGGDPENTWVARDSLELEKLLLFRHSVPETIDIHVEKNKKNEPAITILSTDMAVPDARFRELFDLYRRDLAGSGLMSLIFGHIGENHVHPNVLARNLDEYERGHALFEKWARAVREMGGTITAEHGAGKIKKPLLLILYGEERMRKLLDLKRALDPKGILGPGNVLTEVDA
ncbi:MAG: FAD-binding oxidoreductase [Clostridiales bacterium]|nr:FAD-binding oxidoreductase [Clostridiales bacterium]